MILGYCSLADLKKTLAVLLDNIMLRLGRLESKVDNIFNGTGGNLTNGTSTATPGSSNAEKVNVAGKGEQFPLLRLLLKNRYSFISFFRKVVLNYLVLLILHVSAFLSLMN